MTAEPTLDWQRTSPTAIVVFLGRFAKQVVTQGTAALLPMFAAFATVESLKLHWLLLGIIPLGGLVLLGSVLSYLRFQFRLEDRLILLRQGVLKHERLTIEFHRVQNVSIQEPIYMRPLGLAILSIDTAGNQGKELTISGIKKELAQSLRTAILADAAASQREVAAAGAEPTGAAGVGVDASGAPSESASPPESRLLVERSVRQIARYGLTASGMFWVAIFLGFIASIGGGEWIGDAMKFVVENLIDLIRNGELLFLAAIAAALFTAVLMLPALSVAGALIRHYGYRLTREGDTYRRSAGLITRHEQALKQHKIQSVVWKQNVIARAMGLVTLKLEVARAGSGAEVNASGLPMGVVSSFVVPALDPDEASSLTSELLPDCDVSSIDYSRPDAWRYIGRTILLYFTGPIVAVTLVPAVLVHWAFLLFVPLAHLGLYLLQRQSWKRWGYAVRGGYGFVRSGFLGSSTAVFPLFKTQRVELRQSPHQRRARLAHVTLHLASGSMTVPHIPLGDAEKLRDLALYHAESTEKRWY